MSDTEILIQAMNAQLAEPARSGVNFESCFVMNRLYDAGAADLARRYWNWSCSNWKANPIFGSEVHELQSKLNAIDRRSTMPAWATYGT